MGDTDTIWIDAGHFSIVISRVSRVVISAAKLAIGLNTSVKTRKSLQLARIRPNENKMSDGGRGRASLGVEMWKSSQK